MGKLYDKLPDSFLKKVLENENSDLVENILLNQQKYRDATDKDEKVRFKERLSGAFWDLYTEISKKVNPNTDKSKRLYLRYGLMDMKYMTAEDQKLILTRPLNEPDPEETIFYMDEWLILVGQGKIKPSMTDETSKRGGGAKGAGIDPSLQSKYERISGAFDAEKMNYNNLLEQRKMKEDALLALANNAINHMDDPLLEMPTVNTEDQNHNLDEIAEVARELRRIDKSLAATKSNFESKYEEKQDLERQINTETAIENAGGKPEHYEVDSRTMENEANAIRQMIKMCVGRQGNHFPILASGFLPKETREYNFKAEVGKRLKQVEEMDPSIFDRVFRQNTNRIPPYILLMPGYGNYGICWEPYDKYNKATSKGRIAVPIFTRGPVESISQAFGDFRWQTAKEMASYHWMDEGLTGRYYEYITTNKVKGDIKTLFIEDYILWLTKESQGIQKLHKDARYIFWRFVPFPDKLKEQLSLKGFYYDQLWKKEQSFRMSQGY